MHVDIFDGCFLDSPYAFTFGPQMVKAIKRCCDEYQSESGGAILDLHLCVERPARYVEAMAESGGSRFIFQWEAMEGENDEERLSSATTLARRIIESGMKCGVSINPSTAVELIFPLLETGLVDLVDVLAVEAGFGGQLFQDSALSKLKKLVEWRAKRHAEVILMVDGGVNAEKAPLVMKAGANIVVVGTFLFNHPKGLRHAVSQLMPP